MFGCVNSIRNMYDWMTIITNAETSIARSVAESSRFHRQVRLRSVVCYGHRSTVDEMLEDRRCEGPL